DAERVARGPVAQVAQTDELLGVLLRAVNGDAKIDLVAPGAGARFDGERLPDGRGGGGGVEGSRRVHVPGPDPQHVPHRAEPSVARLGRFPAQDAAYSSTGRSGATTETNSPRSRYVGSDE